MAPLSTENGLRFEQIRKLTEISRALTYTTELDQVLRLAATRAAEAFGAERALLMLADDEGLLRVGSTHGIESEALARFREPLDESLVRRLQGLLDVAAEESFLGVPLVAHGAVTGLLAVVRAGPDPCSEEEEWLLSAVADQVAVALENARLAEEIREARRARAAAVDGAAAGGDAKDRALATLAHDLRSPLNAIDSFAELMEMEILGPVGDRQREALGRIRMSGRHLLAVLENVLEMARIEAGVVRVRTGTVDLGRVVEEATLLVAHTAEARDQQIATETTAEPVVAGDPDRLRQVLINLIGNAIKYTPPGTAIGVRTGVHESGGKRWGAVSVIDGGPGIAAENLEAIFEPYFRISVADTEAAQGAGLGLAIARELVRAMGGDIDVASEVGRGSTFTARLPLHDGH